MAKKKVVGYGMLALGIVKLAFSLAVHSPAHVVATIEGVEALLLMSAGVVLYATDVHKILVSISRVIYKSVELKNLDAFNYAVAKFFKRLSEFMYENIELRGIDAFNYFVANLTISFSQRFRKTHTGVLPYNMLMVFIGAALLMVLLFLFGGRYQ